MSRSESMIESFIDKYEEDLVDHLEKNEGELGETVQEISSALDIAPQTVGIVCSNSPRLREVAPSKNRYKLRGEKK